MANDSQNNSNQTQSAIKDTIKAGVGAAKAAGKAAVGDVGGATIEVVKILPQLLKILGVLLLVNLIFVAAFLSTPAMIWDKITQPYHEWCLTQTTKTIDDAFNKAAANTAKNAMKSMDYYIPNYNEKRNEFFGEEQGGLSKLIDEQGNEFSIAIDETGKDVLISYYDTKSKDYTEFRYIDGNNFINSPVNVNYAEIINAFTYYRSKSSDENAYELNYDEDKNIIGVTSKNEKSGVWKDLSKFESRAWGMTDYAAIYNFITSKSSLENIYNIKYRIGDQEVKNIDNAQAAKLANNAELAQKNNYNHYYQIAIDVSTYDANMKTTSNGKMTYSAFTQNLFNLTNEDMDYVAEVTALSDCIVQVALDTAPDIPEDYSEYFIFSPAKKIFENVVGEKSILQQLTEDGLIMDNLTGPVCRTLVAAQANKVANGKLNITHSNFFGIKNEDTFTQYFGSKIEDSEPGDSGMFLTYTFYKTFSNTELNLRDSLFKSDYIIHSSQEYADFFKAHNSYYTDLTRVEKGDVIFFGTDINYILPSGPATPTPGMPPQEQNFVERQDNTHVGLVTGVNGENINIAIYNFDDKKRTVIQNSTTILLNTLFNWSYDSLVKQGGFKVSKINVNINKQDELGKYISGIGKPNYDDFAKEYNKKYADRIEKLHQSQSTFNPSTGSGVLAYPTEYRKISAGFPRYPSGKQHTGIDFPCPIGTNVYAAADGVVTTSKKLNSSFGFHIKIDHGNHMQTLYGHNSELLVKVGDHVKKGQLIAKSGNTGNSTGPHCHFQVNINGKPVDPRIYLSN